MEPTGKEIMEDFKRTSPIGKDFDGEIIARIECQIGKRVTNEGDNKLEEFFIVRHNKITHQFDNYNQAYCVAKDLFGVYLEKSNE